MADTCLSQQMLEVLRLFLDLHQNEVTGDRLSDLVEEFIKYQMHKASTPLN